MGEGRAAGPEPLDAVLVAASGCGHTPKHYDSLLAKLIVSHRSGHFDAVLRRSQRALAELLSRRRVQAAGMWCFQMRL